MKILLIEDNEQDQKIISRYLHKAGFSDIVIAESGEKGIERALEINPDIIVLDTMLPGIDGFETCRQLKQIHKLPAKVIIGTGRIDAVDANKAHRMGANEYCVKTSDCAELITIIQRWVPSSEAILEKVVEKASDRLSVEDITPETISASWGLEKTANAVRILYRELEKKNEELKVLDKLKSEFVSMVSHELRTPLTIIRGAVSQVVDGIYGDISAQQKEKLLMAVRNTDILRRIIDDLLDLAKLEAHEVKLNKQRFNLVDLVKEVHANFSSLTQQKGLDFKIHYSKDIMEIEADRDRIVQVLTNLVGNALKFTEKGKIEIIVKDHDDHLECAVVDTGDGISEDDLKKVFGRFQQFGHSHGTTREGTGLGLSICKSIMELHKGTIHVESHLGKGSKFIFTLPHKS